LKDPVIKGVKLSSFILTDKNGEIVFYSDPPCPRCEFWMGGEYAGSFECEICGFNEVPKYSHKHGYYPFLEGFWKLLRLFLINRRLKWETSFRLYTFHSWWQEWYLRGRKKITYTSGNANWSWKEKRWIKWSE